MLSDKVEEIYINSANTPQSMQSEAEAEEAESVTISDKSQKVYQLTYEAFCNWRKEKNITAASESVLLAYFKELAIRYKPTSLWGKYSMLKNTLKTQEDVNLDCYANLLGFLKRHSQGFQPKKANIFTWENVEKFVKEAPDDPYLPTKVALILGALGACRATELYQMKLRDIIVCDGAIVVKLPERHGKNREFTVTDQYYEVCKKYMSGRTKFSNATLFHQLRNGKITRQRIGINAFVKMGKDIATFLKLPNPESYSGHSITRTTSYIGRGNVSASESCSDESSEMYIKTEAPDDIDDAGLELDTPDEVTVGEDFMCESIYIDDEVPAEGGYSDGSSETGTTNQIDLPDTNNKSVNNRTDTVNSTLSMAGSAPNRYEASQSNQINQTINLEVKKLPRLVFNNCSNVTINIINKK